MPNTAAPTTANGSLQPLTPFKAATSASPNTSRYLGSGGAKPNSVDASPCGAQAGRALRATTPAALAKLHVEIIARFPQARS
jgi:hypothetical protein